MGHLLRDGGHLVHLPDGHLATEDLTYGCDGNLGDCYKIDGYSDGDLIACVTCRDDDKPIWDGTFDVLGPPHGDGCKWVASDGINAFNIDGKLMREAILEWILPLCAWEMDIRCENGGATRIWRGRKASDNTPVGIYTRVDGCDLTATLSVVECP